MQTSLRSLHHSVLEDAAAGGGFRRCPEASRGRDANPAAGAAPIPMTASSTPRRLAARPDSGTTYMVVGTLVAAVAAYLFQLVAGRVKPVVHAQFAALQAGEGLPSGAARAHALMQSGDHVGKIVLTWGADECAS